MHIDKVLEIGDGDVMQGTMKAIKAGIMDNPFATNPASPCKVMSIKDADGAVRYLNHGNLPFTQDIIDFHKGKISRKRSKEGQKARLRSSGERPSGRQQGGPYRIEVLAEQQYLHDRTITRQLRRIGIILPP